LKIDAGTLSIQKLDRTDGQFTVYNFEVDAFHTYFVSQERILVHNKAAPRGFKPNSGWYHYGDNPPFQRITNPKHHPRSASPEPRNVNDLFRRAIWEEGGGPGWVRDANGTIHRFSPPSNGTTHWNGSNIPENLIPNEIRKAL
jgi:hypothetical protein